MVTPDGLPTTYNNAKVKRKEKLSVKESKFFIPVSIFKDRKLSVLEALVSYLKDNFNLRYREIAVLLNRDERNIWTVYNRYKKKITRKGSFMLTVRTSKSAYDVVVPKHRKKEFELAGKIIEGDSIKTIGDKNIGVVFCDRLENLHKPVKYNEKQSKLVVN